MGADWNLDARGLSRRKGADAWLLHDASLRVVPEERVGLYGASGAGKTVLLRALAALDPVDAGSLWWCGEEPTGARLPAYRRRVGYVHQRPVMLEGTVERNLRVPFELRGYDLVYPAKRAQAFFDALGKPASFLQKATGDLSGGEAQIAALVRSLLVDPAVLLLDEPTAALDADSASRLANVLRDWAADEHAIVCVSHDRDWLYGLCTRQIEVRAGSLFP